MKSKFLLAFVLSLITTQSFAGEIEQIVAQVAEKNENEITFRIEDKNQSLSETLCLKNYENFKKTLIDSKKVILKASAEGCKDSLFKFGLITILND